MTTTDKPTQVGGLLPLPEPAAFMKRPSAQNSYNREEPYFTAPQLRAYAQANVQALEAERDALERNLVAAMNQIAECDALEARLVALRECSESLRGLAEVIRKYGTTAPSALESVAAKIDAALLESKP